MGIHFLKKHIGIILVYATLIIGLCTYRTYGLSWDEPDTHLDGELNFNYIVHGDTTLLTTNARYYGAGFELPVVFMEKALKLTDSRSIYLFQHIMVHLFFVLSAYILFLLVDHLYKSKLLATVAYLLLVVNPLIYGHSFFNSKDIPFLSMYIICFACTALAFNKYKYKYFILLGAACGFLMNFRIMGVLITGCICIFLFIDLLTLGKDKTNQKKIAGLLAIFLITSFATLYITWPSMYHNPIQNFTNAFKLMSKYPWQENLLFNRHLMKATSIGWDYAIVWFLISNPLTYLALGGLGTLFCIFNFLKGPKQFIFNNPDRNNLLYLICFVEPFLAVIFLHSVIYDAWRHLYFTYPCFVLLAIYGLHKLYNTRLKIPAVSVISIGIIITGFYMVKNFPFEHVYFNRLAGKTQPENLRKKWELDYWGTSYKQAFEYILKNDHSTKIDIAVANTPGEENVLLLEPNDRKRINIVDSAYNATYFVTNYRYHPQDYPYQPWQDYFSIKVLNSTIIRVFKIK